MKKIIYTILIFIISSAILLGFNHSYRKIYKNIKISTKIMDEKPDSALKILTSINPSEIKSERQLAQFALYLTQARHKNFVDETSDSLINIAVRYYDANRSSYPYERMLAHYYSGVINTTAHKYSEAITNLIQAEHLAQSQNKLLWLGRVQSKIAKVYGKIYAFSEAAKYDSLACLTFKQSGDSINLQFQNLEFANSLNNAKRNAESLQVSTLILSDAIRRNDSIFIRYAYDLIAHSHHRLKNYKEAADYYNKYIELFPNQTSPKQYWLYIDALWQSGNHEAARVLIDSAKIRYGEKAEIPFEVLYETGYTDEAYHQLKKIFEETDSALGKIIRQDVHSSVCEYHENEIKVMELSHQNNVTKLTILIILVISGGVGASAFVSHSQQIQKRKDEQIIALADELESILNERNSERAAICETQTQPATCQNDNTHRFSITRKHLDTIRVLCETYYESNQKESIKSKTADNVEREIKDFVSTPDFHIFLEYLADNENDGIMTRFRTQMPGLTDKEYHIFVCSTLKLPVPVILMFFDLNRNTLYTTRRRLRQKISDAHPIDERIFLSHL